MLRTGDQAVTDASRSSGTNEGWTHGNTYTPAGLLAVAWSDLSGHCHQGYTYNVGANGKRKKKRVMDVRTSSKPLAVSTTVAALVKSVFDKTFSDFWQLENSKTRRLYWNVGLSAPLGV